MAANLSYESILDLDARLNLLVEQQDQLGQDVVAAEAAVHDANAQYQELAPAINELQLAERNLRSAETRLRTAQARVAGANALLATFGPDAEAMRWERLQGCRQRVEAVEADNLNVTAHIERLEYLRRTHVDVLSRTNTHRVLSSRDLLLRIFQFVEHHPWQEIAKSNETHPAETATRTDFPAQSFTCVSHWWRDTAERCPALWTDLRVTLGPTTSVLYAIERLRGILAVSSRLQDGQDNAPWPLRIRFDRISARQDAHAPVFQLMETEMHRITDLVIDSLHISGPRDDFMRLFSRPTPGLARLRIVVRGSAGPLRDNPFAQAPSLTHLEVKGSHQSIPMFVYGLLQWRSHIQHLDFDGVQDELGDVIGGGLVNILCRCYLHTICLRNGTIFGHTITAVRQAGRELRTVRLVRMQPSLPHISDIRYARECIERRMRALPGFQLELEHCHALQQLWHTANVPPVVQDLARPSSLRVTRATLPGLELPAPLLDDRHIPAEAVRTAWNHHAVPA
ncbi:hypothetical protein EXIGLDRAFT_716429 [Exidia glandulosa HHB12029]|uniref:Uncharacterized protein n=1 Tax=Exidia glandulosa HHB12029 TaxID=1314781 RepID=A0A165P7X2_EXIGL|nr:hypothetical protein EXIGLDRAFT_716429 [Exidia glandulosa HHB12029]